MDELEIILDKGENPAPLTRKNSQIPAQSRFRWGWLIVGAIVVVALVLGAQLSQQNRVQPMPGEVAPLFSLTSFNGEPISLESLRGKIVVVNFWASWCPPCHQEASDLVAIDEDYKDQNVVMIGINWLETSDAEAQKFISRYGISYANGSDLGEKIAQAYRIESAPETYVIDRNGVVADTVIGPLTYDHLAGVLDALIAAGGSS